MSQQNKFRKVINDIHLWLGLVAGIILFIVCLTGTIYTFRSEIEYMVNPNKYNVASFQPDQKPLKIEFLISQLQKQEKGKIAFVTIPKNPTKNYEFGLLKKEQEKGKQREDGKKKETVEKGAKTEKNKKSRPVVYYVDPYTGKIMGKDGDKTSQFFTSIMKLHRWLLLDDSIGRPIVGISTLIFVVLSLSGLILWFPRKFRYWKRWFHWKPGFKIKHKAKWKRINHDLHNTLGFYSLTFLLLMALTGLCWSFEWYKNGVSSVMGSEVFAGRNEKPIQVEKSETPVIPVSEIIRISNQELSYQGNLSISLPKDFVSALVINKNKTGFFALSASDKIQINPYSGMVLKKDMFEDKPLNVQIVSLIKALHIGDVFGTFSKILYFITCLIGTSLPVTGTLIWLNKMKKK